MLVSSAKVRPSLYIGVCMGAWAIAPACTALAKDYKGLVLVRFFLGVAEAPFCWFPHSTLREFDKILTRLRSRSALFTFFLLRPKGNCHADFDLIRWEHFRHIIRWPHCSCNFLIYRWRTRFTWMAMVIVLLSFPFQPSRMFTSMQASHYRRCCYVCRRHGSGNPSSRLPPYHEMAYEGRTTTGR
jgi:hypothetical protein